MKRVTCALPFLFVALIIGCNENNNVLNAPTDVNPLQEKVAKSAVPKHILLNLILRSPGEFNSFIEVNGVVDYTLTVVPRDPIPPNPQFSILTNLLLNAELRPYELTEPVWRVAASTRDDVLPTSGDGTTGYLTKRYFVSGLNKWLCLSFALTETSVKLYRSWLELPKMDRERDEN